MHAKLIELSATPFRAKEKASVMYRSSRLGVFSPARQHGSPASIRHTVQPLVKVCRRHMITAHREKKSMLAPETLNRLQRKTASKRCPAADGAIVQFTATVPLCWSRRRNLIMHTQSHIKYASSCRALLRYLIFSPTQSKGSVVIHDIISSLLLARCKIPIQKAR